MSLDGSANMHLRDVGCMGMDTICIGLSIDLLLLLLWKQIDYLHTSEIVSKTFLKIQPNVCHVTTGQSIFKYC